MRTEQPTTPNSAKDPITSTDNTLRESAEPAITAEIRENPPSMGLQTGLRTPLPPDLERLAALWESIPLAVRATWLATAEALTSVPNSNGIVR